MKKKRKHKIKENTHSKYYKEKAKNSEYSLSRLEFVLYIITLILAILSILARALDNDVVGYDNFTGNPYEWIRRLK